ncbi:MAG: hypothetical protein ACI9XC_002370 [Gammaproteobacteria bacterium]|jgi:hypothetical protein
MKISGHIKKMVTSLESPVQYQLPIDGKLVSMNNYIGKSISLNYSGVINCIACGNKTNKSFNQGHCYRCFISLASCDMCIMKPETCHYHLGTCREPVWGETQCMQHHYVYLANSSGIKVGITRGTQILTRWMDQGASQALPIFRVSNRLLSGKIEVAIKAHVSDRTDWRKMLKAKADSIDLQEKRDELVRTAETEINKIKEEHTEADIEFLGDAEPVNINYPVDSCPEKVTSLNFDKTPEIEGVLNGIKGQYLILDTGVLNIRKYAGYLITID